MIHEIINILSTSITPKNESLLLYLHCINVINLGSKLKVGEGGGMEGRQNLQNVECLQKWINGIPQPPTPIPMLVLSPNLYYHFTYIHVT